MAILIVLVVVVLIYSNYRIFKKDLSKKNIGARRLLADKTQAKMSTGAITLPGYEPNQVGYRREIASGLSNFMSLGGGEHIQEIFEPCFLDTDQIPKAEFSYNDLIVVLTNQRIHILGRKIIVGSENRKVWRGGSQRHIFELVNITKIKTGRFTFHAEKQSVQMFYLEVNLASGQAHNFVCTLGDSKVSKNEKQIRYQHMLNYLAKKNIHHKDIEVKDKWPAPELGKLKTQSSSSGSVGFGVIWDSDAWADLF